MASSQFQCDMCDFETNDRELADKHCWKYTHKVNGMTSEGKGKYTLKTLFPELLGKFLTNDHCKAVFAPHQLTYELYRFQSDEGVYGTDGKAAIAEYMQQTVAECTTSDVKAMCDAVARSSIVQREELDEMDKYLVLGNCVFDPETKEFHKLSPDFFSLNKLPFDYNPNAQCPNFMRFLNEVCPDSISTIQEVLGAILRKKYLLKKILILNGESGTGKSTLLDTIGTFLGRKNYSTVKLQAFSSGNVFVAASLYRKLANISDELSNNVIQSSDELKDLSGESPGIEGQYKFGQPFSFKPYAFLIAACNNLPPMPDDDALWARIALVNFTRKFGGHARHANKTQLIASMTTPEELSGIFNFALEGLKRIEANNWGLTNDVDTETTRTEYKRKSQPVYAFLEDCTADTEGMITKDDLYEAACKYFVEKGIIKLRREIFFKQLKTERPTVRFTQTTIDGKRVHAVEGLSFKPKTEAKQMSCTHMSESELGFGSDCEYCGRKSCATYRDSEGRLLCDKCAKE